MGQTVCRYVTSSSRQGKTTPAPTWQCDFQEFPWLADMFSDTFRFYYDVAFGVVGVVLVVFLWLLTALIRFKDFSRNFVISNLFMYTLLVVTTLTHDVVNIQFKYIVNTTIGEIIRGCTTTIYYATVLNFFITLAIFQLQNVRSAYSRLPCNKKTIYFIFPAITLIFYAAAVAISFPYYGLLIYNSYVIRGAQSVAGALSLLCIFPLCCSSSPRQGQLSEPSVANARSRMGWSILFAIVANFPVSISVLFDLLNCYFVTCGDYDIILLHITIIGGYVAPIIFVLVVILFLPAYRSTLFCSQGYVLSKVADVEAIKPGISVKKPATPPPPAPSVPIQNLSVPTFNQFSSPYRNNQPPVNILSQPDFGAILSSPPNVTSYNPVNQSIAPSIPLSNQPCLCAHGNPIPTYITTSNVGPIEQYHMVQHQTPAVITQHQIFPTPVHQSNLVRFSSQPNLATLGTIQPAVSMPQINLATQSPFYISN